MSMEESKRGSENPPLKPSWKCPPLLKPSLPGGMSATCRTRLQWDKGALELKSDEDGNVTIDVIPIGDVVRLQVIAPGWKTYGDDYKIDSNNKEITVRMKRPSDQYSLYNNGGQGTTTSNTAPKGQSTSAKPSEQTPIPQ